MTGRLLDLLRRRAPARLLTPLRAVRHLPDRLLHPFRRRRALSCVRRRFPVRSVLFVCHGNICRSPYAAGALARELERRGGGASSGGGAPEAAGVRIESCGFIGPDRRSPPEARRVAARRGVDLEAHLSRLVEARALAEHDLVLVMDPGQRRRALELLEGERAVDREADRDGAPRTAPASGDGCRVLLLGDLDPAPIRRRAIRDPVTQPEEVFERVYDRIDRCCGLLAHRLLSRREGGR